MTGETSRNYYWVIISTGFVLNLTAMGFGRYAYPMLLPSMQEGLGLTYGHMGTLGAVNLMGYLAFALLSGMLATRYGSKTIAVGSTALVGATMVALGLVSSYLPALILMVLAGVGTAGVFVPTASLGQGWASARRGGFTMGFLSMGAAAGMVIAAYLVPIILASQGQDGWRYAWVYLGTAAVVVTALAAATLRERPQARTQPGAVPATKVGNPAPAAIAWSSVYRNPAIVGLAVAYFLFGFYQIYATFFVAYLRRGLALPTEQVGNIWFYWAVLTLLFILAWGTLSDRIGRKQAITPCLILLVASTLLPVFRQDIPMLYVSAMLYGATFAGPMMIILAAAGEAVDPSLAGAALGLVTAAFGLGQAVSPAIAGFLIDLSGSFYPGFILSAAVVALSFIILLILPLKRVPRS